MIWLTSGLGSNSGWANGLPLHSKHCRFAHLSAPGPWPDSSINCAMAIVQEQEKVVWALRHTYTSQRLRSMADPELTKVVLWHMVGWVLVYCGWPTTIQSLSILCTCKKLLGHHREHHHGQRHREHHGQGMDIVWSRHHTKYCKPRTMWVFNAPSPS